MKTTLRRGLLSLALVGSLSHVAFVSTAHAQSPSPTAIDVQNYWPTSGPSQAVALRSTDVQPHLALGFGLLANFMYQPLVFRAVADPSLTFNTVNYAATADFVWALGLLDRFQIGLAIPIVLAQDGDGASVINGTGAAGRLPLTAVRDVRFDLSWAIVRRERTTNANGFGLRLDLGGALPTGDRANYQGAPEPMTFAPMLVADYRVAGLTITANVGARIRNQAAVARVAWASQLYAGLGVAYRPTMFNRLAFGVDYQALVPLYGDLVQTDAMGNSVTYKSLMPMELYFGARYAVDRGRDIEVSLGGGVPLTRDATNPAFRVMAGISYAPRGTDDDHDQVRDAEDQCPAAAEDRDGFQDDDGCPDPDNDGDNIVDTNDQCPLQPEDVDNFNDTDGCPDADNDDDNVPDGEDECATESAGAHPDPDHRGCPIRDRDDDGVLDAVDQCPAEPRGALPDRERIGCPLPDADHDRVEDARDRCPSDPAGANPDRYRRGCPDPDRDHDGVANETDRCVDRAETINGVADDDGCPEEDGAEERTQWAGPVLAFANAVRFAPATRALTPAQNALFVQAAQRIRGYGARVRRIHIAVVPAAGPAGQRNAERLAGLVLESLASAGVPRDRMVAEAWSAPAPAQTPAAPAANNPAPRRAPARPTPQPVGELRIRAEFNDAEVEAPSRAPRPRSENNAVQPGASAPGAGDAPAGAPAAPSGAAAASNPCGMSGPANPCAPSSPPRANSGGAPAPNATPTP